MIWAQGGPFTAAWWSQRAVLGPLGESRAWAEAQGLSLHRQVGSRVWTLWCQTQKCDIIASAGADPGVDGVMVGMTVGDGH